MLRLENIHRITIYSLLNILILFHLCFAEKETELDLEDHDGMSWKPPRRHLLWNSYSSSGMNTTEITVYVIALIIITILSICCKICIKQGCEPSDDYSDAVVHPPPRRHNPTVPVVPSSGRIFNPPRSSNSIILPPEPGIFSVDFTGIENPNYHPSLHEPAPSYYLPVAPQYPRNGLSNENPTPLLDLPPSYESAVKGQHFPKVN